MLRWNRTLVRATATAAVVGMVLVSVGGALALPGPALVVLVLLGVAGAVAGVWAQGRRRPPG